MTDPDPQSADAALAQRHRRARRTAWIVAALAVAVYVGFILTGVLGQ